MYADSDQNHIGRHLPDRVSELSAAEVLEHIDGDNLVRLLKIYGKVKRPRALVTDLVESRYLARSLKVSKA